MRQFVGWQAYRSGNPGLRGRGAPSKDCEQLPKVSEAFVYVASILLLVRRLARTGLIKHFLSNQ